MSDISEELRVVNIHDRDFQKYSVDRRIYCVPVDEREEDRLTAQHDIIHRLSGQQLFLPSIPRLRKILDCGYGRGDWVVHVAEEHEDCEVTGVDIYPLLIDDQPDNLELYGYNLNDRLNDPEVFQRSAYDLIHSRFVAQGIKASRWTSYVQDMKRLLRSDGWIQMTEYYANIQSDSGRLTSDSALRRWWETYVVATERANRNPRIAQRLQHLMRDAGLRDVGGTVLHLPIGAWDADVARATLGRDSLAMIEELLVSVSIWPFTEILGWSAAQVQTLIAMALLELRDVSLKLYIPIYIAWGRRRS